MCQRKVIWFNLSANMGGYEWVREIGSVLF